MLLAEWNNLGTLVVVKPRGAALAEPVKPAMHAHPMAAVMLRQDVMLRPGTICFSTLTSTPTCSTWNRGIASL